MSMPTKGACHCRRGLERDNCPDCEGTGQAIDWRAWHSRPKAPAGFADRVIQRLTAEQKKPEPQRV